MPVPRPGSWTRSQAVEWLEKHPVRDVPDIEVLRNEVLRVHDVLTRTTRERSDQSAEVGIGSGGRGGGPWRGTVPYLRIIMCLTQDNVKRLFLSLKLVHLECIDVVSLLSSQMQQ